MMPEIVNEVLGFILAIGLLLWIGASPVIAARSLKTVTKAKKPTKKNVVEVSKKHWRRISDHIRTTTAPPIEKPSNVIDSCSPEYEINDKFSWNNNEHSRSKRKRLLHR